MMPFPRSPNHTVSALVVCDFTGSTLAIKEGNEYDLELESSATCLQFVPKRASGEQPGQV